MPLKYKVTKVACRKLIDVGDFGATALNSHFKKPGYKNEIPGTKVETNFSLPFFIHL